jgi:hypothetical protein
MLHPRWRGKESHSHARPASKPQMTTLFNCWVSTRSYGLVFFCIEIEFYELGTWHTRRLTRPLHNARRIRVA